MAMIAFYAGLLIGILLGFLLSSLLPSFLGSETETLPGESEGYSQADPLEP